MKKTKMFDRLPNVAGVYFDGFKNITIKSREIVKKDIEGFIKYCEKEARGTAVRVILGEWGEGKSEAYYRYIKPSVEKSEDYAFFLSASTLANCYEDERTNVLLDSTPLTALKFLVAIFQGIREESRDIKTKELILPVEDYTSAENYTEDLLEKLLEEKPRKRIFIFIDEFEELLLNRNALKNIVSGIKETINGLYGSIHENGRYEGAIHLFISCTPDAYYKLQISKETSLIFGGLGRRAKVIDLPEIRKKEGIDFLWALLCYSYHDRLPQPLPIENLGIFNLLLRITRGNLGNLVSLYTNALNSVRENDYLEILDYKHILSFLEKEQIFIYGGQTRCIEQDTYFGIIKYLKDQKTRDLGNLYVMIFKLLIGELKPFSVEEIEKRTRKNKKEIQSAINIINQNVQSIRKIDRTIIKVAPLKEDKNLDDVLDFFEEYIEIDKIKNEKMIRIENHSEYVYEFKDRITQYKWENGNVVEKIFLPIDELDIRIFFDGEITHEKSIELRNALRKLRSDETYYMASDILLNQIFPTPTPKGLEFITNRELRLKLWREVSRNMIEEFDRNMPEAFLRILKESDIYDFIDKKDSDYYSIVQLMDKKTETALQALFYPINGDIKSEGIEKINNVLNMNKKIHLSILLYTGEITPEAQEKILNKELGKDGKYLLVEMPLHPSLTKKILCGYIASTSHEEDLDNSLFKTTCREVITQELMFDTKLLEWVKEQEKRGVVISQISTSARSLKEFSDALKFYINYSDEANSPDNIFDRNMSEVLRFRKYGTRTGLLPSDFESANKIAEISIDLHNNGFLRKVDGVYKVVGHPVEDRIIQIIEKEKKITVSDLRHYFVIKEQKKKVFEDVYLNILEYKGKIQRDKSFYKLIDSDEFYRYLKEKYDRYKETIKREEFKTFGHFYVIKEHDENLIMISDFDNFLTKIFEKIESLKSSSQKDIFLQRMSLCSRLIAQFNDEFAPAIKGASKKAREILKQMKDKMLMIEEDLNFIVNNSKKWLRFDFDREHIIEYEALTEIYNNIAETCEKLYSQEELNKIKENISNKRIFKFDKPMKDAYYFNIKLFELKKLQNKFEENSGNINKFIVRIKPFFEELNDGENEIHNKLKIKEISDEYRISKNILNVLKSYQITKNIETQSYRESRIKLRDIEKSSKEIIKEIRWRMNSMNDITDSLGGIVNKEKDLLFDLEYGKNFKEKIISTFDINKFKIQIEEFESKIAQIEEEYNKIATNFRTREKDVKRIEEDIAELRKTMGNWKESIDNAKNIFQDEWNLYKQKTVKFIKRVKEMLILLSKKHEIERGKIDKKIEELSQKIKCSLDELEDKISFLENIKKEISQTAINIAKKYISDSEAEVLYILYSKKDEKSKWITYEELVREIKEKHEMDENDIKVSLEKLVSKKYILHGFSLSL
ncbi:MAG TPA: hypothetical protein ENI52_03755 [Thermoplasmata archaeon]|nr:hypothetical protein [Thermoplasmata archaeon]